MNAVSNALYRHEFKLKRRIIRRVKKEYKEASLSE